MCNLKIAIFPVEKVPRSASGPNITDNKFILTRYCIMVPGGTLLISGNNELHTTRAISAHRGTRQNKAKQIKFNFVKTSFRRNLGVDFTFAWSQSNKNEPHLNSTRRDCAMVLKFCMRP
jgi:hypothetical protein